MNFVSKNNDNYVFEGKFLEGKFLIDKVGKCGYTLSDEEKI
jgi:hypothetical protein